MKWLILPALVAASFLVTSEVGHSQAPAAPQTAVQRLQAMKVKNKELIDRQTETLKKLEEIQLEAQQIKFLGKRS